MRVQNGQMLAAAAITFWVMADCLVSSALAAPGPVVLDSESTPPRAALEVTIDKSSVDLENHRLELRMSRPAGHVRIQVFDASGSTLAEHDIDFRGRPANERLVVRWKPKSDEPVAKIEVYAYDVDDNYKGIAIVPWSLAIPHEDVTFETNSATIRSAEETKLKQSLEEIQQAFDKHKDLGNVTLFIAGHTDTRGSAEHNRELSRRRARAIAQWFRSHGYKTPIAYEGFGEHVPKVKTADEVDEPRNRRVDYVLSVEPPRLKSTATAAAWKRI
jgi:outer membrane protein OmpA-like peptidoglycan-associated protein